MLIYAHPYFFPVHSYFNLSHIVFDIPASFQLRKLRRQSRVPDARILAEELKVFRLIDEFRCTRRAKVAMPQQMSRNKADLEVSVVIDMIFTYHSY